MELHQVGCEDSLGVKIYILWARRVLWVVAPGGPVECYLGSLFDYLMTLFGHDYWALYW